MSSLIVCEKTGRWAAALRCAAGSRELPISEVRSLEQAERELSVHRAAIVAMEVGEASLVRVATRLAAWSKRFPDAAFLILAEEQLVPLEPRLRETGALHAVFSPRDLSATVRLIRRHLARAARPPQTLEESIWARLPWSAVSAP